MNVIGCKLRLTNIKIGTILNIRVMKIVDLIILSKSAHKAHKKHRESMVSLEINFTNEQVFHMVDDFKQILKESW